MAHKDPEKRREYQREWERKNRNKNFHHYDFETHRELAMNSGIETQREWWECHKMGLIPNGIYADPPQAFREQFKRKGPLKNNNTP